MRKPKSTGQTRVVPLAALSLALAFLVSAAPPALMDPLQALPAGALFVVSAGNPGRMMANALSFTRKADLGELEAPLASVLDALEGNGDMPGELVDLAALIDWNRRLVLAVYAPREGTEARPGLLAFIPAGNPSMVQKAVLQASETAGDPVSTSLALPGYVLVAIGMEAPATLDFKRADIPALAAYPASSLAAWVNVEAGKEYINLLSQGFSSIFRSDNSYDDDFDWDEAPDQAWQEDQNWDEAEAWDDEETWDDEWDGDWDWDAEDWDTEEPATEDWDAEEPETDDWDSIDWGTEGWSDSPDAALADGWNDMAGLGNLGSLFEGAEGMFEALADILGDIQSIDFGLTLEADRLWIRSGVQVAHGGTLYRMSTEAASGQLPLPYLPYMEADALVSMTWAAKADWAAGILETLYGAIFPDVSLLQKALAAIKASMTATGANGAMNFDFRLSDELAAAIRTGSPSEEEAIPLIGRGLVFDATGVMQLVDRQGFRDALRESMALVEDPAYQAILQASTVELQVNRRTGLIDGMPYDSYEYGIRSTEEGGMTEGVVEIIRALAGPLLSPVYVYRNDKAYLGFGKPETLRPLIGRDRAARPLQGVPRFRALRGGAPANARGLVYLSTGTLMRRIMKILPEEKGILPFGYGDLYGVLGWLSASPGQLGMGLGLGAEDIKAFRSLAD